MKTITIELILQKVCEYFKIEQSKLISRSRKKSIAHARHIYYILSRQLTKEKLFTVALLVERKHTVVTTSIKRHKANKNYLVDIQKVKQSIYMIGFLNDDIDLLELCVKQ